MLHEKQLTMMNMAKTKLIAHWKLWVIWRLVSSQLQQFGQLVRSDWSPSQIWNRPIFVIGENGSQRPKLSLWKVGIHRAPDKDIKSLSFEVLILAYQVEKWCNILNCHQMFPFQCRQLTMQQIRLPKCKKLCWKLRIDSLIFPFDDLNWTLMTLLSTNSQVVRSERCVSGTYRDDR